MRAIQADHLGGSDVLAVEPDAPEPHAGPGQLRVRIKTAAVNPFDIKVRSGMFQPALPAALPWTPGYDGAGVVDEVGPGVTGFAVGDEVLGHGFVGAYAEYSVADAAKTTVKPANVTWEEAGGFASVAATAQRVLAQLAPEPGSVLLVHAASGSVGALAVQLAVAGGLRVIGSAGARSQEAVRALGAQPVEYGPGLIEAVRTLVPGGVDRALDCAGRGDLPALIDLAGGAENVLTIADPAAGSLGVRFSGEGAPVDLAALVAQLAAGALTVTLGEQFALEQAAAAQDLSASGHAGGRVILTIS